MRIKVYKRKFKEEYERISIEKFVEFMQKSKIGEVSYVFDSVSAKSFSIKCIGIGKLIKTDDGFNIIGEDTQKVEIEYNQIQDVIFVLGDEKQFDLKDIKGNNIIITVK